MSDTDEMIPPAAAMLSQPYHANVLNEPPRSEWGDATLAIPPRSATDVTVRSIPRGSRNRSWITFAHACPVTASITSPAVMNMRFEYP
jgi:hypothetical protein